MDSLLCQLAAGVIAVVLIRLVVRGLLARIEAARRFLLGGFCHRAGRTAPSAYTTLYRSDRSAQELYERTLRNAPRR